MRKWFFILLMSVCTCAIGSTASAGQEKKSLPVEASEFIQKYFPGYKIVRVGMEREFSGKEYKAYINKSGNAYKLEFDAKGQVKEIDAQGKASLPESSVPAAVVKFVKENYPDSRIMEWSKSRKLQMVELDNDLELVFDRQGNLVKIDD